MVCPYAGFRKMNKTAASFQKLRIRKAVMADDARLAALATELGYRSTAAQVRRRLRRVLRDPRHAVYVAETLGDGVAGWAHVFEHRVLESDAMAEVGGLIVGQRFRGLGVGKLLMA